MPEGLLQLLNQIRDIWNNLPQQARIVVPIVGVVILGALIGFSLWSGTEEDQVIFSNLLDRDLRMVQGELANARIIISIILKIKSIKKNYAHSRVLRFTK